MPWVELNLPPRLLSILTLLWLGTAGCGASLLWRYALTPGTEAIRHRNGLPTATLRFVEMRLRWLSFCILNVRAAVRPFEN